MNKILFYPNRYEEEVEITKIENLDINSSDSRCFKLILKKVMMF